MKNIITIFFIFFLSCQSQEVKGKICLVIDDFGHAISSPAIDFLKLDENITIAIIPGTPYAEKIGQAAYSRNIETIIHMPMEAQDSNERSWYTISEKLNSKEVDDRIVMAHELIPWAKGMNNHQGSKATENLELMKSVARSLKKLNLFFLDSFTNPESRAFITMRRYGVKTELRQVFLDHKESYSEILNQLDSLVLLSHSMDVAIGIGHAKPLTLQVLKDEIPKLRKKGYSFVKLSEVVR